MAGLLAPLIASVLSKPEVVQRRISGLVGAIVADAASQHLQWIYDQDALTTLVGDANPEFWFENRCAFFNVANGKLSCYGDEILTTLETIGANNNSYNEESLYENLKNRFSDPESPYQIALAKRPEKKYPIDGPWLNGGLIKCFANYESGVRPTGCPDNHDADGFCLALPSIIQKSSEDFETTSKKIVQILTTNDLTVRHNQVQAKIIQAYIDGEANPIAKVKSDIASTFPEIVAEIEEVEEGKKNGESVQALVKRFGLSCGLPGSFQSSLVTLLEADSYVSGIRTNMKAGGDCCSRSIFIGACLGAAHGIEAIPVEWLEKVDNMENILKLVEQIMA